MASVPSIEQKSHLAGTIARALAVFCVDEIIIFRDDDDEGEQDSTLDHGEGSSNGLTALSHPSHYLAHLLSYLETPPHLRKRIFPMHPNLRTAGLLPSLDMPHHLRQNEWCDYREGVVVKSNDGSILVDTGLPRPVTLSLNNPGLLPEEGSRISVLFSARDSTNAELVERSAPREEAGYYWGYSVRRCSSLSSVFTECPFDGGYDLSFGTSERGVPLSDILDGQANDGPNPLPKYEHLLLVFGGVAGLEAAVRNDSQLRDMSIRPADTEQLFDYWVNLLPGQGSRTIRTEEAVWIGLTSLTTLVDKSQVDKSRQSAGINGGQLQDRASQRHIEDRVDQSPVQEVPVQEHPMSNGNMPEPVEKKKNKKKKKSKKEKRSLS